jgi:uncharacterized protein YndB with AHSA1/START domain
VTERSVTHATFVIERTYPASPPRVFAAWADPTIKSRWFVGPEEWGPAVFELDFRIGGREISRGGPVGGPVHAFEGRYYDIVPNERIVYAYEMHIDETRISVSVATVELKPSGAGTRLIFTEQGAYLDGHDTSAEREHGTGELLEALGAELQRQPANA